MAVTHKVEIAFATDPDAVTPTWTDVTAFVQAVGSPIVINRGRADQLSTITPSQMTVTLDNHDGRFTAGYTSGAYYPNVVLGKRIRVSTNAGAGFVARFDGYVNAWPVGWAPTGKYAEATITAVDRLARLGRQLLSDNLISTYYLQQNPTDYWMFADPEGTTVPYNRSGQTQLQQGFFTAGPGASASVVYGAGTGPGYDGLTALEIQETTLGATGAPTRYTFSETQSLSFSGFFRVAGSTPSVSQFAALNLWDGHTPSEMLLVIEPSLTYIDCTNSSGVNTSASSSTNLCDGSTHHIAGVWEGLGVGLGGTISVYADGVLSASASVSSANLSGGITAPVGMVAEDFGTAGVYTCAHYALFPSALTAGQVLGLANSGLTAFGGETSSARISRLGILAGFTASVSSSGSQSMAPLLDVANADILSLMNVVADTDNGVLYVTPDGTVKFLSRANQNNLLASWTLTAGQYDADLSFLLDDFGVVNDVTADRPGGNPIHQANAASVTANGTYSQQKTLQVTSDLEVLDFVNWTLAGGSPVVRCNQVSVNLLTQPSLVTTWLTMDLGRIITLSGLPSTAPATSVTMMLQGYTETIGLDTYSVQMNASDYGQQSHVFILANASFGLLDSPYVLGY